MKWNPFRKAVECVKCKAVFFKLERGAEGPRLVPPEGASTAVRVLDPKRLEVIGTVDLNDDKLIEESARCAFCAVRRGDETEMSPAERDVFRGMAVAVHRHLWSAFKSPTPRRGGGAGTDVGKP